MKQVDDREPGGSAVKRKVKKAKANKPYVLIAVILVVLIAVASQQ